MCARVPRINSSYLRPIFSRGLGAGRPSTICFIRSYLCWRLRFGASFIVARPVHRTARVLLDALDELERGEAKTLHEAFNRALRRRWTTLDVCVLDELYFVASAERGSARTARWRVSPILVHHGTADVPS